MLKPLIAAWTALAVIGWSASVPAQTLPETLASDPARPRPGDAVKDMNGGVVGTVIAIEGDAAKVRTDRLEVLIPLRAMMPGRGAVIIALTRDEVNSAAEQALASRAQPPEAQPATQTLAAAAPQP